METQVGTGGEILWALILDDDGLIVHGLAELHCLHGPQDNRLVRASGGSLGFWGREQLADFPADSKKRGRDYTGSSHRHRGLLRGKPRKPGGVGWQHFLLPWEMQMFSFINPQWGNSALEPLPSRAEGILVQPCRTHCEWNTWNSQDSFHSTDLFSIYFYRLGLVYKAKSTVTGCLPFSHTACAQPRDGQYSHVLFG